MLNSINFDDRKVDVSRDNFYGIDRSSHREFMDRAHPGFAKRPVDYLTNFNSLKTKAIAFELLQHIMKDIA